MVSGFSFVREANSFGTATCDWGWIPDQVGNDKLGGSGMTRVNWNDRLGYSVVLKTIQE